jgi:hypothetical protein
MEVLLADPSVRNSPTREMDAFRRRGMAVFLGRGSGFSLICHALMYLASPKMVELVVGRLVQQDFMCTP